MPWNAVHPSGIAVGRRRCPHAALAQAFLHQVTAKDLENKTPGMVWEVPFGTCPRDNGSAAAAWYRVLSVPCAGEGRHAWKVSVSYWSYNPPRQWLWFDAASSSRSVHAAKDVFFGRQVQDGAEYELEP